MPPQIPANRSSIEQWQTEQLRLTAFPTPTQIGGSGWWEGVVGEPPENRTLKPKVGVQQDEGPFEHGRLMLAIQPDRVDWLFTTSDEHESVIPFPIALASFNEGMFRWFENCPSMQRLAFGAILTQPITDRIAGYRQLSAYLPSVNIDAENSSDFSYQINRPRSSKSVIAGLRINRLTKWSVQTRMQVRLLPISRPVDVLEGPVACRLELDINTSQDYRGEFSKDRLREIFQELVEMGREIASEGDIP